MNFSMGAYFRKNNLKAQFLLFAVLTLAAFFPTFFNDFQRGWDDNWQLLENPFVLDASLDNLKFHFTNFYRGQYSPVNTLVYVGIYELFGFDPFYFHFVCLLLHLANVILVYQIIKVIAGVLKPGYQDNRKSIYAFFAALLFAVHPLQVESVAWISASKVLLYSFFFLSSLLCYIKYVKTGKRFWLLFVSSLYLLSFGSKEQAIILPLNLLVIDYAFGRFRELELKSSSPKLSVFLEKIPFFLLALSFWYFSAQFNLGLIGEGNNYPFYQRLLMGMHSLNQYIFRFVAPVELYYYYFYPIEKGESLPLYYWGYCLLTGIIGWFLVENFKKNNKIIIFGALFFFVNILLVLHILPMPREMITADRYMYISIVGLAFILVWFIDYIIKKFRYRKLVLSLLVVYLCCLGSYTFSRTSEWKNSETMKKNVAEIIEKRKLEDQHTVNKPLFPETNE